MPVADYITYCRMLEEAGKNKYAFPAVNVCSIETANAALAGFARAKSDGIIMVSIGGGEHASGLEIKDSVIGAIAIANYVHLVAEKYNIYVALHTDHCKPSKLEAFVVPLIRETEKRRARGEKNLFNSHMFDGSELPINENIRISRELMTICSKNEIVLEVEVGVVGGEEDGVNNEGVDNQRLYTTPEDMLKVYEALEDIPGSKYMLAATFGNVHGVYKPGNVKLKPEILKKGQDVLKNSYGSTARFLLVFHGGSGSCKDDITRTLEYGVVKMNIDTDTQYAFTRPIAGHMYKNYDGVLKIDSEVGSKKVYDPRSYLKLAQEGMTDRVFEACRDLRSEGKTLL